MGSFSSKMEILNINVPDIPKLSDSNNYWNWRILVRAYLEAMGLWSGQAPVECPQSKFILLSTIEFYLITRDYELKGAVALYHDLFLRFGTSRTREL